MVAVGVVRVGEADEVGGHDPGALVQQLVEGVLAVGAGLAPHDRAGVESRRACRRGGPTCRSTPCRAVGGRPGSAPTPRRRAAPPWWRSRGRCGSRRRSCRAATGALAPSGAVRKCSSTTWNPARKSREVVRPDGDHQRQPDRRVDRVAAADPLPEAEHVGGVDAERRHLLGVRADGDEVAGDGVLAEGVDEPGPGGAGVGQRLDRA